jgi:hypothetical protein
LAADHRLIRLARYLWASPNTVLGLLLVTPALAGGRLRLMDGTLEACGGGLKWMLGPWAEALTLGDRKSVV